MPIEGATLTMQIEDKAEWYRLAHVMDAFLCINKIVNDDELRSMLKHGIIEDQLVTNIDPETGKESLEKPRPMTAVEAVEWYRARIYEIVDDEGIDLVRALE